MSNFSAFPESLRAMKRYEVTLNKRSEVRGGPFDVPHLKMMDFGGYRKSHKKGALLFRIAYGKQPLDVYYWPKPKSYTIEIGHFLGKSHHRFLGPEGTEFDQLFEKVVTKIRDHTLKRQRNFFNKVCNRLFPENHRLISLCSQNHDRLEEDWVHQCLKIEDSDSLVSNKYCPKVVLGYNFVTGQFLSRVGFKGRKWTEDDPDFATSLNGAGMALQKIIRGYY